MFKNQWLVEFSREFKLFTLLILFEAFIDHFQITRLDAGGVESFEIMNCCDFPPLRKIIKNYMFYMVVAPARLAGRARLARQVGTVIDSNRMVIGR